MAELAGVKGDYHEKLPIVMPSKASGFPSEQSPIPQSHAAWPCKRCGALVIDRAVHDAWHESATTRQRQR